jgi:hypothetical protein
LIGVAVAKAELNNSSHLMSWVVAIIGAPRNVKNKLRPALSSHDRREKITRFSTKNFILYYVGQASEERYNDTEVAEPKRMSP